jgi:hypothetical protein
MGNRIIVLGLSLAAASIAATVTGSRLLTGFGPSAGPSETSASHFDYAEGPVEALDRCVQERFHTITDFGMSRLPVVPQHVDHFDPETPEEKAAVAELQRQGLTVGLYLGGRGLLGPTMSQAEWDDDGSQEPYSKPIGGPIVISGEATPEGLPGPRELWEIGREALMASAAGDRHEAPFGRWSADVRPIRANQKACLGCHSARAATGLPAPGQGQETDLKIGDALGVVIYLYARNP